MNDPLVFTRIYLPVPLDLLVATRLLTRLSQSDTPRPLIFETRADDDGITFLAGTSSDNVMRLQRLVSDQLSESRTTSKVSRTPAQAAGRLLIRSAGLPLNFLALEGTVHALYAALAGRREGEHMVLQLALGRGHRPQLVPIAVDDPTRTSIWDALTRGNAPASSELRTRLKTRAEQPTIEASLRIGVTAATPARRRALALEVLGALKGLEAPGVRFDLARDDPRSLNEAAVLRRFPLVLSPPELAPFLGWPIGAGDLPGLPGLHPRRLAAPATLSRTENVFATSTAAGDERPVGIRPGARLQHLVLTGPTGSGKSMVFGQLILADITARRPVVVVDPKRQLIDFILDRIPPERADGIAILDAADPNPLGFNPLDTEGRNADVVVDGILAAFKAVFEDGWGPRTEDLLHAGLLTLARAGMRRGQPYTLLDLPRLLTDAPFRRSVVGAVETDPTLASFWAGFDEMSPGARSNIIAAPMNKLRKYVLRQNLATVLGQPRPRFRLRDVFREGKTVLVPLNDALLGPGAAQLLGSLVTSELWMATLERATEHNPTSRPASIYIDEVQQFLNLPTSIADALATSRSYGVSWNLAHQFRAQLPASLRAAFDSNARNKIVFALGPDDARDLARMTPGLEKEDFMTLPTYEIYANVVDQGAPAGWFSARTLPPAVSLGSWQAIRDASRTRYGAQPPQPLDAPVETPADDDGGVSAKAPTHRKARRP